MLLLLVSSALYAADTKDAQYYINQFNEYFKDSCREVAVSIGKDNPVLPLGVPICSGRYMQALDYINEGIKKFPDRLDMRVMKADACAAVGNAECINETILETLKRSAKNKNRWLGAGDKLVDAGKEEMFYQIQLYAVKFDNAGRAEELRTLANNILKYYPNDVIALNNLGSSYSIQENYDQALKYYLKAEKLAPSDDIVINNIADNYYYKGDMTNALKYYHKLQAVTTKEDFKEEAEYQIKEITSKL